MTRRLLPAVVALVLATLPAGAQNARARATAILTDAMATAKSGDTAAAIRLLKRAVREDDSFWETFYNLGVLQSRTSSMAMKDVMLRMDASENLNKSLQRKAENPWAYLELGKLRLKTPGLRINAMTLFERALTAAERSGAPDAVADVTFEIAQIFDRRFQAVANRHQLIGNTQVLNPYSAQYDREYVEQFLRESAMPVPEAGELDGLQAEDWYRKALAVAPGHEGAITSYAALLYANRRYEEIVKIAQRGAIETPSSARIRLAEGLALLRTRQSAKASETLEKAVSLMTERERSVVASLAPNLKTADARAFEALDAASRAAYERAYWDLADPLYLTSLNETRLAFLGRVAFADLFFTTPDLSVRGALTDRGQIVLRYGEPPTIATFAPDVTSKNDGATMAQMTTLWWYPEILLKFVFTGPPAFSNARFAGDFQNYAEDLRAQQPVRYDNLIDDLKVDTVPVQIARFRGNNPQNTRVEFHAAVPVHTLAKVAGIESVPIETGLWILDAARRPEVDARDTVRVTATTNAPAIRSWTRQFRPGEYAYRVEALEAQSNRAARAGGALSIGSFDAGSFTMSDVLLGTALKNPNVRRRDELDMTVLPDHTLDPGQTLGLYWESYGAQSRDGGVAVQVELSVTVLQLNRPNIAHIRAMGALADRLGVSQEGTSRVTMKWTHMAPAVVTGDDRQYHVMELDLGDAPPARYQLELKLTDLVSGKTTHTSHVFNIRRPTK
ncbi:MAG TPA: GWxTD domain-containing protein [Gemmatimonadaceae bacterium]|nr:GWxTD domain-containing protein [Gemmatimonadaceae bacterium]